MVINLDNASDVPPAQARDRALVVGDASSRPTIARALTAEGCAVTTAPDGEAALRAALKDVYLVGLLCVEPANDLGLLRRLRAYACEIPIAIVSTCAASAFVVEAMRLGACDYLAEPVSPVAIQDLLHRMRARAQLRQSTLVKALQLLTPGLVHELRNPLSGIMASGQMLAHLLAPRASALRYVDILQEEAGQLGRLLARLAEFGRLHPVVPGGAGTLDLHAILERSLAEVRETCAANEVQVVSRFAAGIPEVSGDPGRAAQACAEVLQNALAAMPRGGALTITTRVARGDGGALADSSIGQLGRTEQGEPRDKLTARPVDPSTDRVHETEWIEVEFSDTGSGMTEEAKQRALEPFFSTRPRALGVGLSLAQAVMIAHGGTIRITSDPAGGTRVVLSFPVTE
jgi:signal transduction histidine kinase